MGFIVTLTSPRIPQQGHWLSVIEILAGNRAAGGRRYPISSERRGAKSLTLPHQSLARGEVRNGNPGRLWSWIPRSSPIQPGFLSRTVLHLGCPLKAEHLLMTRAT